MTWLQKNLLPFRAKLKWKHFLQPFSYHNTSTTKTLSPFSPSLDLQKYSKRLFGIHCLYLGWHLLFLWPQHTIIYTNYSNKNSRLKPWLYELTFVELLRLIFNCLPVADEMAITKQSRFYLEHVVWNAQISRHFHHNKIALVAFVFVSFVD